MVSLPVIDATTVRGLRELGGDKPDELMDELFELLLTTAQSQLSEMRAASAPLDRNTMMRAAHTLRGSASSVGAMEVSFLCGQLEVTAKNGGFANWPELVNELDAALVRLRQTLSSMGYTPKGKQP